MPVDISTVGADGAALFAVPEQAHQLESRLSGAATLRAALAVARSPSIALKNQATSRGRLATGVALTLSARAKLSASAPSRTSLSVTFTTLAGLGAQMSAARRLAVADSASLFLRPEFEVAPKASLVSRASLSASTARSFSVSFRASIQLRPALTTAVPLRLSIGGGSRLVVGGARFPAAARMTEAASVFVVAERTHSPRLPVLGEARLVGQLRVAPAGTLQVQASMGDAAALRLLPELAVELGGARLGASTRVSAGLGAAADVGVTLVSGSAFGGRLSVETKVAAMLLTRTGLEASLSVGVPMSVAMHAEAKLAAGMRSEASLSTVLPARASMRAAPSRVAVLGASARLAGALQVEVVLSFHLAGSSAQGAVLSRAIGLGLNLPGGAAAVAARLAVNVPLGLPLRARATLTGASCVDLWIRALLSETGVLSYGRVEYRHDLGARLLLAPTFEVGLSISLSAVSAMRADGVAAPAVDPGWDGAPMRRLVFRARPRAWDVIARA